MQQTQKYRLSFNSIHFLFWCGQRFRLVLARGCEPPVTSFKEILHSSLCSPKKLFF